jgi:hypothetical protein
VAARDNEVVTDRPRDPRTGRWTAPAASSFDPFSATLYDRVGAKRKRQQTAAASVLALGTFTPTPEGRREPSDPVQRLWHRKQRRIVDRFPEHVDPAA